MTNAQDYRRAAEILKEIAKGMLETLPKEGDMNAQIIDGGDGADGMQGERLMSCQDMLNILVPFFDPSIPENQHFWTLSHVISLTRRVDNNEYNVDEWDENAEQTDDHDVMIAYQLMNRTEYNHL